MLCQAVITMCLGVFVQHGTQSHKWLYDLMREVVEIHRASPDPPLLQPAAGLFM
jgi:hypothetical protein